MPIPLSQLDQTTGYVPPVPDPQTNPNDYAEWVNKYGSAAAQAQTGKAAATQEVMKNPSPAAPQSGPVPPIQDSVLRNKAIREEMAKKGDPFANKVPKADTVPGGSTVGRFQDSVIRDMANSPTTTTAAAPPTIVPTQSPSATTPYIYGGPSPTTTTAATTTGGSGPKIAIGGSGPKIAIPPITSMGAERSSNPPVAGIIQGGSPDSFAGSAATTNSNKYVPMWQQVLRKIGLGLQGAAIGAATKGTGKSLAEIQSQQAHELAMKEKELESARKLEEFRQAEETSRAKLQQLNDQLIEAQREGNATKIAQIEVASREEEGNRDRIQRAELPYIQAAAEAAQHPPTPGQK
jgi:hypothetical protein